MVKTFLVVFVLLFSNTNGQNIINSIIKKEMSFSNEEMVQIVKIGELVKDKKVVILGEAGHGDGKTFEIKVEIIKYLKKYYGFNIVALEGGGFFDFQYLNQNIEIDSNFQTTHKNSWYSIWSSTKQLKPLLDLLKKGELVGLGVENQPTPFSSKLISYLKMRFENKCDLDWHRMLEVNSLIHKFDTIAIVNDDIYFLQSELKLLQTYVLQSYYNDKQAISQSINNLIAFLEQFSFGFDYEGQNKGINVRDKQMAENIIWFVQQNPNAKIVFWTANFHAAKQISLINYGRNNDPHLYDNFVLAAEYLKSHFKDDCYSICFTSSKGRTGTIFEKRKQKIPKYKFNLEYELLKYNKKNYGFVNFQKLKFDIKNEFESSLLGYHNKIGKWDECFDGLFYIRKNQPATVK